VEKVRIGVIGTGGIGQIHLGYLREIERAELTCVCDNRQAVVNAVAKQHGVKAFTDPKELIGSGLCDALLIATPHFLHPPIAMAAMNAGLHVLTEKPMAVRASDADGMIAAAQEHKVKLAVMFQQRTDPLWKRAKAVIDSGALGHVHRTCMMESYFRTQAYYDSGDWRGTWAGEGGGVLLNQAPHGIDCFIWLGGMPGTVLGRTATKAHVIEVEDLAMALLSYPNGAVGTLYVSTYEFPQVSLFQFVGDRAVLEMRNGVLRLGNSAPPSGEMLRTSKDPWDIPMDVWTEIEVPSEPHGHRCITRNFVGAILDGEPLIAPGEEALRSLELANAITVSGTLEKEVKLPLERKLFDELLDAKIKTSKAKKKQKASDRVVIPRR
jgi:predicted dehydrogenase